MRDFVLPEPLPARAQGKLARGLRDYQWGGAIPLILVHLLPLGALWSGTNWQAWTVAIVLYWVRMFGVTAGYHRYFSHRTFKTSRPVQFLFALLAQSAAQRGVLWWAAHHRDHHKYSDGDRDVHSPVKWGFWHAQIGWVYDKNDKTNIHRIKDFAKYPELRFLDKYWLLPPTVLGFSTWLIWSWPGLFIGFFLSTAVLWHCTFTINSFAHMWGKRRYATTDDSRNNWFLALLTMGEGWHNNHHHHMSSCRQGFYWWEIDMSYYVVKAMSWVGLVWDVREPPRKVYEPASDKPVELPKAA